MKKSMLVAAVSAILVAACAGVPTAPDVMALPGTGRNFEEFRADDMLCRDYASQQIGGTARERAANDAVIRNAAIGTAIGAVAGAAIGGRDGAGFGAGTGLVIGGLSGAETARGALFGSQRQYDNAYIQCMYGKGHRVPVSGAYTSPLSTSPPVMVSPPPPPVGNPPPPPAGALR